MDNNHQLLRIDLLRRLRATHPTAHPDALTEVAERIERTGAFAHNGERIVPIGNRSEMNCAALIDATVCGSITRDHVAAASTSSSPEAAAFDRWSARMQAMGVDPATAFDDDGPSDFYGLGLSNFPKDVA